MAKRTERYESLNVRRGFRFRRWGLLIVAVTLLFSGAVARHFRKPPEPVAKVQEVPLVDENFEKLQHQRQMNRELQDRMARAIQLLDEGKLAGAEKVLKGEEE